MASYHKLCRGYC